MVARHGGSVSGEHGDGRARSALLDLMYSPDALTLFSKVKAIPMEIGGGFGAKLTVYAEPVAAALARQAQAPVKITMGRTEVFESSGPTSGGSRYAVTKLNNRFASRPSAGSAVKSDRSV